MQRPLGASAERTCLGCRSVLPKTKLLRVALVDDCPRVDIKNRAGGRGAYICLKTECLSAVRKKKGAFARALKKNLSAHEVNELFDEITYILNANPDSGFMDGGKV